MGESEPRVHFCPPFPLHTHTQAAAVGWSVWLCYMQGRHSARCPDGIRKFSNLLSSMALLHTDRIHWLGAELHTRACSWNGGAGAIVSVEETPQVK